MKKRAEKIEDLLNLIEGLPLHDYAAPSAGRDLQRKFSIDNSTATEFVRIGMSVPGDQRSYNYGHGILLRKSDRDKLIRCLRAVLRTKRGNPGKDEDDRLEQAFADRVVFEAELAKIDASGEKKNRKTLACEALRPLSCS